MTPNEERMAVNSAIERLIAQEDADGESARIVINYGSKLKLSGKFQFESTTNKKSSGGEVSGYSPQHGEITVKDEKREEQEHWEFGVHKDRIGHYRLWKSDEGRVRFQHFWKSSLTTQSIERDGPPVYCLGYDPTSLEPTYLGVVREKIVLTLWLVYWIEFKVPYLEAVYGEVPNIKGLCIKVTNRKP